MANTYNPARVVLNVAGKRIQGFVKESFIRLTKPDAKWTAKEGINGEITFNKNNSKLRQLEFDLMQNAPDNDFMSGLNLADDIAEGGVLYPVGIVDQNGATVLVSGSCVIMKPPDVEFAAEAGKRTWTLLGAADQLFIGGTGEGGIVDLITDLF